MPVRLPAVNDLDGTQRKVVHHTPYNDAMFVSGPPGSGKTHIAILRLNVLIQNGYTNVLFLLYNHSMFGFLSTIFNKMGIRNNITIDTKDIFFKRLAESQGYRGWNNGYDYEEKYSNALSYIENLSTSSLPKNDLIIVDECQDFSSREYRILERMSPKILAVGDFEQAVFTFEGKSFMSKLPSYQLGTIYRYGQKVASIAEHFSDSYLQTKVTNDDKTDVYKVRVNGQSDSIDKLKRLIDAKKMTDMSIAILSLTNKQLKTVSDELSSRGVDNFYCGNNIDMRNYNFDSNVPVLITPFSAKGMEFDCVILYGYSDYWLGSRGFFGDKAREIIYVSLTRTCKELYLIQENSTYSKLSNLSEWVTIDPSTSKSTKIFDF